MPLDTLPVIEKNSTLEPYEKAEIYMKNGDYHFGFAMGILNLLHKDENGKIIDITPSVYMGSSLREEDGTLIVVNPIQQPIIKSEIEGYIFEPILKLEYQETGT